MNCSEKDCKFYQSNNPYGSRSHCSAAEWEQGGTVWCDEIEKCKWYQLKDDIKSRLRSLEKEVRQWKKVK